MRGIALALVAALALAGCDTRGDEPSAVTIRDLLRERVAAMGRSGPGFEMPSRAALDASEAPVLYIAIPAAGAEATLAPVAQNAGAVTWLTLDEVGVTTRAGVIVATRGLGADLMSADIAGLLPALSDPARVTRVHYRLDGDNRTEALRFVCETSGAGRETLDIVGRQVPTWRVAETCRGPAGSFVNRYWLSAAGRIVQSEQWLTPGIGAVTTRLLAE